jgi:hypothetical protein
MDEVSELILGKPAKTFVTDQLLDAVKAVESGGNARAVNPQSGAMGAYQFMPGTVKALQGQGVKFDPFNEPQAREAARGYLQTLLDKNDGNVDKALAQYGGFVTKDPSGYISKVKSKLPAAPTDEISALILGTEKAEEPAKPAPKPVPFSSSGVPEGNLIRKIMQDRLAPKPAATAPTAPTATAVTGPTATPDQIPGSIKQTRVQDPSLLERVIAGPETAARMIYGAGTALIAAPVGVGKEILTGTPKEETARKIMELGSDVPMSPGARANLESLGSLTSNLPAFVPAIGQAGQISQGLRYASGRSALTAEQALRDQFAAKAPPPRVEPGIGAPAPAAPAVPAAGQPKPKVTYADLQAQLQQKQAAQAAKETALTEFANAPTQRELQAIKAQQAQASVAPAAGIAAPPGSVGAAAVTNISAINAALAQASPQLQAKLNKIPRNQINLPALESHLQAEHLGLGSDFFTEGQATQNPGALSFEMNERGKYPALSERFSQQDAKLKAAVDRLHDRATKNEVSGSMYDHGVRQISEYEAIDKARNLDINQKYKALKDAAGGSFPIDAPQFVQNARNLLDENLKTEYLPDSLKNSLERFASGEPLTFQKFEALRTNIAADMRKAGRADDGNTKYALSLVRQALEDLPLKQEAQSLKSVADQARRAAKERFDALEADPAYDAAVNGAPPDTFMEKHVFSKTVPASQVQLMRNTFGEGSTGALNVESALINHLREKGGLVEKSNVSQATYNKTFKALEEKLRAGAKPETVEDLRVLGNVLYKTKARPAGSFVNNSNTFVAQLAQQGGGMATRAADVALVAKGLPPLASSAAGKIGQMFEARKMKRRLEPGAGVKNRD